MNYHVGYHVFLIWASWIGMYVKLLPNFDLLKAFKLFDDDESGKITFGNLQRVANELGENLTDEELQVENYSMSKKSRPFLFIYFLDIMYYFFLLGKYYHTKWIFVKTKKWIWPNQSKKTKSRV